MQTTKKCRARDISRLESEDHINKAKDSTHEDAHLDKTKRKLVQNSSVKKTKTKQQPNKTKTKPTLKPHFKLSASPPEKGIIEI